MENIILNFDKAKFEALKLRANKTNRTCAKDINLSEPGFQLKLRGRHPFNIEEINGLARSLNCKPADLLTESVSGSATAQS